MNLSRTQALDLLAQLSDYVSNDSILIEKVSIRTETVDIRSVGEWASKASTGRHTITMEVFQNRERK